MVGINIFLLFFLVSMGTRNSSGFTMGAVVLLAITLLNIGLFLVFNFVFDTKNIQEEDKFRVWWLCCIRISSEYYKNFSLNLLRPPK
jgi:hypothetical protein